MSVPTKNLAIFFRNIFVEITDGTYLYGCVSSLPSTLLNSPENNFRMWNFCLAVELSPNDTSEYIIKIDATQIDPKPVEISFDDVLSGIFTLSSKTLNAYKYMTYEWDKSAPFLLTFTLKLPCRITKQTFVYINVNVNDSCASPCAPCSQGCNCYCTK